MDRWANMCSCNKVYNVSKSKRDDPNVDIKCSGNPDDDDDDATPLIQVQIMSRKSVRGKGAGIVILNDPTFIAPTSNGVGAWWALYQTLGWRVGRKMLGLTLTWSSICTGRRHGPNSSPHLSKSLHMLAIVK